MQNGHGHHNGHRGQHHGGNRGGNRPYNNGGNRPNNNGKSKYFKLNNIIIFKNIEGYGGGYSGSNASKLNNFTFFHLCNCLMY